MKYAALSFVSTLALMGGIANASITSSDVKTTVSSDKSSITVDKDFTIKSIRSGNKEAFPHHCCRHHRHGPHHTAEGTGPKNMVSGSSESFVPNYSRVITPTIINQGEAGWDYLGQHKVTYNIYLLETKTPYYANFNDFIGNVVHWNNTSVATPTGENVAIVNTTPDHIRQSAVKYMRDKKANLHLVKSDTVWTGEKLIFGKDQAQLKETSNELDNLGASVILDGNVYGQNYLNLGLTFTSDQQEVEVSRNANMVDVSNANDMASQIFKFNIASNATFIYAIPPEKKHGHSHYILITPTITPVVSGQ